MPDPIPSKGTERIAASIEFPDDYDLGAEQKTDEAALRAQAREATKRITASSEPTARGSSIGSGWTSLVGDSEVVRADPNWSPPPDEPREARTTRRISQAEHVGNDAETMQRIRAREQARAEESSNAMHRRREKEERERAELAAVLPRLRERQQQEIQQALQRQLEQEEREGRRRWQSVAEAMQEAANVFLALGICPDHVEWLPQKHCYRTWKGRLYAPDELAALRDADGQPMYTFEERRDGQPAQAYSPRERAWGLHQPVSPDRVPFTIDRILPMPMLFEGEVRFSAQIAHTIRMSEGVVTVYVVGRLIYFAGQLAAAQRAWKAAQRIDHRLAAGLDQVGTAVAGAKAVVHDAAGKVGETVKGGVVSETLGSVTDAMSAGVDGVVSIAKAITTRLIRRK